MSYTVQPIYQKAAFAFINAHHRHHRRPAGWLIGTSAIDAHGNVVGVICVGRTVARGAHHLTTAEVTRCCVLSGLPEVISGGRRHAASVCSMLYAAAWHACRAIGVRRLITYLRADEPAVTMRALKSMGWRLVAVVRGESWDRPGRRRDDKTEIVDRQLWEINAR